MLAGINEIKDPLRPEMLDAVLGAGNVGRGIEVSAVALPDDDSHRLAVLALPVLEEHHVGALALHCKALLLQISDDFRQHGVVHALPHDVGGLQAYVHPVVDSLVLRHGHVNELLPHAAAVIVTALQAHYIASRLLGKCRILVILLLRGAVEGLEVAEVKISPALVLHLLQVGDEHAELGSPVADMVSPDHLVAEELEHPRAGVSDDR